MAAFLGLSLSRLVEGRHPPPPAPHDETCRMKARTPPKADTRELRAEMNWDDWVEYCGDVLPQRLVRRVMDQGADLRELLEEHLGEDPTGYVDTKLPTPVIAANEKLGKLLSWLQRSKRDCLSCHLDEAPRPFNLLVVPLASTTEDWPTLPVLPPKLQNLVVEDPNQLAARVGKAAAKSLLALRKKEVARDKALWRKVTTGASPRHLWVDVLRWRSCTQTWLGSGSWTEDTSVAFVFFLGVEPAIPQGASLGVERYSLVAAAVLAGDHLLEPDESYGDHGIEGEMVLLRYAKGKPPEEIYNDMAASEQDEL